MINIAQLRRLAQAVSGWSDCNQAWLDQSEDIPAAVVGHVDEDGNTYPVASIDCDQYCAAHQSLPLAKFYAAANPAAIEELLDNLEAAEKEAAHQKALADSALRVAEGWERKCGELRALVATLRSEISGLHAKIEQMEKQKPGAEWGENRPHHYTNCVPDDMLYRLGTPHDACLDGVKGEYEMNNEFIREERYIVFKESDLGNSLKGDEIRQLSREYAEQRRLKGKGPLKCVVVESDWPEYEPTWRAIEARVTSAKPAPSVKDAIIDDLQSQFNSEGITEHDSGDALIRLSDAIAAVEDNFVHGDKKVIPE